jgi:uncharacterized protein
MPSRVTMDLEKNWPQVLRILNDAKRTCKHFAIATVDPNGNPHVTPIGHAFFRDDMTGFYFDAYSRAMPRHFAANNRICLMAVNSSSWFWLRSLVAARFATPPGIRIFGTVSEQRDATQAEVQRLSASIRTTQRLRGHNLLWGSLNRVRDMRFTSLLPVEYPVMCDGLWES